MKKFYGTVLIVITVGFARLEGQSEDPTVVSPGLINELAEEARTRNPALRATEKMVEAAHQNEKSIRTWEDPTIRFGRMAAEKSMRREDGDLEYGIEQKLPLFGKPEAARRVAATETGIEQATADLKLQSLRKEIAVALFESALAERTIELAEEDVALIETLLAVAEQRYETRTGTQLEILRLQNERSRRLQSLRTDGVLVTNSIARVNRLIGRPLHLSLPQLTLPDLAPPISSHKRLVDVALQAEPALKKMRREVERAEAQAEQTRRQRYPDFTVGVEARNYTGTGEFREGTAFVAFNFPWGNRGKYEADYKREKARQEAAELDAADYEFEVQNEIHQLVTRTGAVRQEALLYRDEIIPRTETSLESARAAWESNVGSLNDLLDARRLLLDARVMYARAVSEQYQLLSQLALRCGLSDLEAVQRIAGELPSTP